MGGFTSLQFPALSIRQPESPLTQVAQVEQIKSAQQSQQMGEIQLQQARQNQISQQTLMSLYAQNKGDLNQTYADAAASGQVLPEHLLDFRTKSIAAQVQAATLSKEQLANHKTLSEMTANELDSIKNMPPEQQAQGIKDSVGRILQAGGPDTAKWLIPVAQDLTNNPTPANFTKYETAMMGEKWVNENALKGLELTSKPTAVQAQAKNQAELDKATTDSLIAHQQYLSMPSPAEAKTKRAADLLETQASIAQKRAATAHEVAETALIGANPVIAFDPTTQQRVLTTMPQANAKGLTNPVKVSESDINKETEATKQFNDVQMNVSRFRNALNSIGGDISSDHASKIAQILSDKAVNLNVSSLLEVPGGARMGDILSQTGKAKVWNDLTPQEQEATIGYLRAKGSVIAFQKALTQTGRTSKEALEIEMQNLPSPLMGATVGNKQLDAFQENIDTASKGLTRVPWLPSPQEVRQNIEGQHVAPPVPPKPGRAVPVIYNTGHPETDQ